MNETLFMRYLYDIVLIFIFIVLILNTEVENWCIGNIFLKFFKIDWFVGAHLTVF